MEKQFDHRNNGFMHNADFSKFKREKDMKALKLRKKNRFNYFNETRKKFQATEIINYCPLNLEESFKKILSNDLSENIKGTFYLRKYLGEEYNPPIQEIIDSGVLINLVESIKRFDCPELQYEASWALSNIASGEIQYTRAIVQKGAVPFIINLLDSPLDYIKEQGIWILGNLTGDSGIYSELVCQYGGIRKLINIIENNPSNFLISPAIWALGNMCKGEKSPEFKTIKDAVWVFCKLLLKEDEEIIKNSLWVISSVTEYSEEAGNLIIDSGAIPRIIKLINHNNYDIQMPAILTIGHIAAGNDLQTSVIIENGSLEALLPLLDSPKKDIRKESIWCFSNISAGSVEHIEKMIEESVFKKVIRVLYRDEREVQIEALWTLANAAGRGSRSQVCHLVKIGTIQALTFCLSIKEPTFLQVVLLGIKEILYSGAMSQVENAENPYAVVFEESGGVAILEKLQEHSNTKISEEVFNILTNYFDVKYEDQDLLDLVSPIVF